MFMTNL